MSHWGSDVRGASRVGGKQERVDQPQGELLSPASPFYLYPSDLQMVPRVTGGRGNSEGGPRARPPYEPEKMGVEHIETPQVDVTCRCHGHVCTVKILYVTNVCTPGICKDARWPGARAGDGRETHRGATTSPLAGPGTQLTLDAVLIGTQSNPEESPGAGGWGGRRVVPEYALARVGAGNGGLGL